MGYLQTGQTMKAVLITSANRGTLASRHEVESHDLDDMLPLGYYYLADFGDENLDYDLLQKVDLDRLFTIGVSLENGFFEIVRK